MSPSGTSGDVHAWRRALLQSALHRPSSPSGFEAWWANLRARQEFHVERVPLRAVSGWRFDDSGALAHESGRYFQVRGIRVRSSFGPRPQWSQPIIAQPEIGILGILTQQRDGVLRFLMQAKMEPGNINALQLSPTLQATWSNYTRVHRGLYPPYLEHFIEPGIARVRVDRLQSEQGARFLRKRNRNMVLELPPDVEVDLRDNFRWMTLGELRQHLRVDTLVNMNTRSVLSCLQLMAWDRPLDAQPTTGLDVSGLDDLARMSLTSSTTLQSLHSTEELMDWLTRNKCNSFLEVTPCRLDELSEWVIRDDAIAHREDKYFAVIGVEAQVGRREVGHWCQPMIWQRERGIVGFLVRRIDDVMHVLVQAKIEPGNVDVVELAPTVQCITGSYLRPEYEVPFLDYFTGARGRVHVDVLHSEEGGRFYQELNRYMVVEVDHDLELPADRYVWMTMAQVKNFIMHNNCFNIEARSLVSCMGPV